MAGGGGSVSAGVSIGPTHQPPQPPSPGERDDRGGFGSNNIPLFGGSSGGSAIAGGGGSVGPTHQPPQPPSPGERSARGGFGSNTISLFGGTTSGGAFGSSTVPNSSTSIERSREIRDGALVSKTRVQLDDVNVTIEESDSRGIVVTVRELVRGKEKTKKYKAKDVDALAKKHPAAMEWVRKYHTDSEAGTLVLDPSGDASPNAARAGNFGSTSGSTFGSKSNSMRFGGTNSSSHSSSGFGGGSGGGGGSIGGQSGATSGGGGNAGGPNPATEMMLQHLEKAMSETENAVLREQYRTMIEQVRNSSR